MTKGDNDKYLFGRNSENLQRQNLEVTQDSKENSQWQRTTIWIKIYRGINKSIGNKKNALNGILLTIRQTNRKDQSRNRNVFVTLYQLSARWLDRMNCSSRIPLQWQETCSNQTDAICSELWKMSLERKPQNTNGDS